MSVLTSLGILILAVFACGFLQLVPGIFLSFYHYASAKNSRDAALNLSSFFIVGRALIAMLILFLTYFAFYHFLIDNPTFNIEILYWVLAGILALLGVFIFFFYYRRSKNTTELFISRKFARSILEKTRKAKKPSDIFVLGMAAGIPEIIFVLPVYAVLILEIINFPSANVLYHPLLFFTFILLSMTSTLAIRGQFYRGHKNLADIERARVKNKLYYRIMLSVSYILLAAFIISFRIFG